MGWERGRKGAGWEGGGMGRRGGGSGEGEWDNVYDIASHVPYAWHCCEGHQTCKPNANPLKVFASVSADSTQAYHCQPSARDDIYH